LDSIVISVLSLKMKKNNKKSYIVGIVSDQINGNDFAWATCLSKPVNSLKEAEELRLSYWETYSLDNSGSSSVIFDFEVD
jgi:hypothetical protein